MAKSLEDLGKTAPSKTSGHIARLRSAAKESKKRSGVGIEELGNAYEARKEAFPLSYKQLESGMVVFLNEGVEILAHTLFLNWKTGEGYAFPTKERVRCAAYTVNKEGAWESTGKTCPFCVALGREPRLTVLWAVADLRQPIDPKTNKKYPIRVKRIEMEHEQVLESIFQGIEIEATKTGKKPLVQYARFKVSRTSQQKSLGCGDSWTMVDWVDPALCAKMMDKVPVWNKGWPIFSADAALALIAKHVKICNEHQKQEAYSAEGYARLLEGADAKPEKAAPKAAGAKPAAAKPAPTAAPASTGKSLEDLAEAPAEVGPSSEPTLEEMVDLPEGDAPAAEETQPAEPEASDAPANDAAAEEDGSFDPWSEEEGG